MSALVLKVYNHGSQKQTQRNNSHRSTALKMFWKRIQYPPENPPVLKPALLRKLPVLYQFFHENRRTFEVSTSSFCPFFHENRRLFEVSASSLPFRKPQVIWSFCQFFTISKTAGYLGFLPVLYRLENRRLFEVFEMIRTRSCYCDLLP